jgi:hypothetical protein
MTCTQRFVILSSLQWIDFTTTNCSTKAVTKPYSCNRDFQGHAYKEAQYNLMFLLQEHVMFALTSSITQNLFRNYLPFGVVLILKELKHGKPTYKFAMTLFSGISALFRSWQ